MISCLLHRIIINSRYKSRQILPFSGPFRLHPGHILFFRPGFSQHHNRTKRFTVHTGDQEYVSAIFLLPQLANLNFSHAHGSPLTVETPAKSVNNSPRHC